MKNKNWILVSEKLTENGEVILMKNNKISVVMLYPGCNVLLDYNENSKTIARRLKNTNIELWDPKGKILKKFRLYEVKKRDRKNEKNSRLVKQRSKS